MHVKKNIILPYTSSMVYMRKVMSILSSFKNEKRNENLIKLIYNKQDIRELLNQNSARRSGSKEHV